MQQLLGVEALPVLDQVVPKAPVGQVLHDQPQVPPSCERTNHRAEVGAGRATAEHRWIKPGGISAVNALTMLTMVSQKVLTHFLYFEIRSRHININKKCCCCSKLYRIHLEVNPKSEVQTIIVYYFV